MRYKVLFVGVDCDLSRMIYHALKEHWTIEKVIFEQPVPLVTRMKIRYKKLGFWNILGQLLFKVFTVLFVVPFSRRRKTELLSLYGCHVDPIPVDLIVQVENVHHVDWNPLSAKYQPDFIFINGTRILKKSLLDQWAIPVINIHAGITPMYRGVHGGYWSLVNSDPLNFGATIHLVDSGIDTGQVLRHVHAVPNIKDNFYTYPYLQFAEAIKVLDAVVQDYMMEQKTADHRNIQPAFSKLWYYPSVFEYIYFRIIKGVK